jgi:two-component sensor histidine kinase
MGTRLFAELEDLRGLKERRELEKAKRTLEIQVHQKELLLKEANHRIKNSLQIVSSILHLQVSGAQSAEAASEMRKAASRVLAIAAVHERLYTGDDITIVSLDVFLRDLCEEVGRALGCTDGIQVDFGAIDVPTDMAVPIALIASELVTNAIKYGAPPYRIATRRASPDTLMLSVSDAGQGPPDDNSRTGMGSRIMQAFTTQLDARIATNRLHDSYTVELTIPVP